MTDYYLEAPGAALTLAEREWIRAVCDVLANEHGAGLTMVHLGIGLGGSMHCSRAGAPEGRLVGVDLDTSRLQPAPKGAQALDAVLIEADSALAGQAWEGPVHFLFVDGDHRLAAVIADVQAWRRHVAPGGIVAFHDYGNDHLSWCRGVARAVNAFAWDGWEELPAAASVRAFQRLGAVDAVQG